MKTIIKLTLLFCMSFGVYAEDKQNSDKQNNFETDKKYYTVDDQGRVGKKTYNGWRRYGSCAPCHGPNATGGIGGGANLLESIQEKKIDFAAFKDIVSKGRLDKGMPAWEKDPNVSEYYPDIYGYLRARSDGVIKKGGRPKKIPFKETP